MIKRLCLALFAFALLASVPADAAIRNFAFPGGSNLYVLAQSFMSPGVNRYYFAQYDDASGAISFVASAMDDDGQRSSLGANFVAVPVFQNGSTVATITAQLAGNNVQEGFNPPRCINHVATDGTWSVQRSDTNVAIAVYVLPAVDVLAGTTCP